MATINFYQVNKEFGDYTAVAPFELTVETGEFLVLVGPSGCGKTTILRMLAGLESPTKGQIFLDGDDITELEPKNRDIAMVFQNYALYPHMTVYNNMAYALKLRKFNKKSIADAVNKAAAMLDLQDLFARYPRQLSGGQQQRVALGRAIVRQPKVFLMDEPLSNLDAKLRVQTRTRLIQLHKKLKATIVYVTHDQIEAMTMGTRIVLMKKGVIQQVGEPIELYQKPVNRFVAAFMGTPPMQFLNGEISRKGNNNIFQNENCRLILQGECQFIGRACIGIRPEDLELCSVEQSCSISGVITIIENIGAESIVHFNVGDGQLAMKLTGMGTVLREGEIITVRPINLVHVFDETTGNSVARLCPLCSSPDNH